MDHVLRWTGPLAEEGEWYRPQAWRIDGIAPGDHVQDVYRRFKSYGEEEVDQFGDFHVRYRDRKLELVIGKDFRVREIRILPEMK